MDVEIIGGSENSLKTMFLAARNCYYKGDVRALEIDDDSVKLLKNIYERGHLSIFEHSSWTYYIGGVSRSALAQFTRHRIGFSYAVKSQHFQKHEDFEFKELEIYKDEKHREEYFELMSLVNEFYKKSLKYIPRHIAREVLPNSCLTNIIVTANLRSLDDFWKKRKTEDNTPEIMELSRQMYNKLVYKEPYIKNIIKY